MRNRRNRYVDRRIPQYTIFALLGPLLGFTAIGLSVAIGSWWVLVSYFELDVPASLMWVGDDGWCRLPDEGIGVHCFGDFNERVAQNIDDFSYPAWPNNLETSPIGPFVTYLADLVATYSNPRTSLLVFAVLYAVALLTPIVVFSYLLRWPERLMVVGLLGVGTYPFLAVMDRLNSIALAVPLMAGFLYSVFKHRDKLCIVTIVMLASVKPSFAILALYPLAQRRYLHFLAAFSGTVLAVVTLIVVAGGGKTERIGEWLGVVANYGSGYRSVIDGNPPNASFARLIYVVGEAIDHVIPDPLLSQVKLADVAILYALPLAAAISTFLLVSLVAMGKRIRPLDIAVALLAVSSLGFGSYIAAYYIVFSLAVAAILVLLASTTSIEYERNGIKKTESAFRLHSSLGSPLGVGALVASFSLVPIPALYSSELVVGEGGVFETIGISLATMLWFSFVVQNILWGITDMRKNRLTFKEFGTSGIL